LSLFLVSSLCDEIEDERRILELTLQVHDIRTTVEGLIKYVAKTNGMTYPTHFNEENRVGSDSEYIGGTALRRVDRALQQAGLKKDNPVMKAAHSAEHLRRSAIAAVQGDSKRASDEFKRARRENDAYVGRDSDYAGGEALRWVDQTLQSWGFSRDHPLIKFGHGAEHLRRAIDSYIKGNPERAAGELARVFSNSEENAVGKDSDYAGGEALRWIDKKLQSWGLSRDSPIMKTAHAIEHLRRAADAYIKGDVSRAQDELKRAKSNFNDENVAPDSAYAGGEALRWIDKKLQSWGLSRDSAVMRTAHAIEHLRRAAEQYARGDASAALEELQRAKSNF